MGLVGRPYKVSPLCYCARLVIASSWGIIENATVEGLDVPEEHTLRLRRPSCDAPSCGLWRCVAWTLERQGLESPLDDHRAPSRRLAG